MHCQMSIFNFFYQQMLIVVLLNRYHQKAPTSWTALTPAFLFFVIGLLVGYILYGAAIRIVKVEDDFHEMQELKVRAEAADVAKSQVGSWHFICVVHNDFQGLFCGFNI